MRDIIYMRTISEVESLLAFLLLVFLWRMARIAVAARELSPREPVIPSSPTATSLFLCISVDSDIALAPTRASALSFNALVSGRTMDSARYGTLATPTWSRTLAVRPNGQEMDLIFTESVLVSPSGSW